MADQNAAVKGGVVAYLNIKDAIKAAEFYQKALGAELAQVYPPDEQGRTMHAHLYVNGSSVMLSDPFPEHGCPFEKSAGYSLMLPVADVDGAYDRAVSVGCAAGMPPTDMFWGDRYAQCKDPYGVTWAFVGPKKG